MSFRELTTTSLRSVRELSLHPLQQISHAHAHVCSGHLADVALWPARQISAHGKQITLSTGFIATTVLSTGCSAALHHSDHCADEVAGGGHGAGGARVVEVLRESDRAHDDAPIVTPLPLRAQPSRRRSADGANAPRRNTGKTRSRRSGDADTRPGSAAPHAPARTAPAKAAPHAPARTAPAKAAPVNDAPAPAKAAPVNDAPAPVETDPTVRVKSDPLWTRSATQLPCAACTDGAF